MDGARIFDGSFNFNPCTAMLNTEMGLLIDSPMMASGSRAVFDTGSPGLAWRVERQSGRTVWVDPASDSALVHEPGTTLVKRMTVAVVGLLPVEWLL